MPSSSMNTSWSPFWITCTGMKFQMHQCARTYRQMHNNCIFLIVSCLFGTFLFNCEKQRIESVSICVQSSLDSFGLSFFLIFVLYEKLTTPSSPSLLAYIHTNMDCTTYSHSKDPLTALNGACASLILAWSQLHVDMALRKPRDHMHLNSSILLDSVKDGL